MMDISIQHEEDRSLLKRKDYRVRIFHGGSTPSRNVLIGALAGALHADKDHIVVRKIAAEFGSASSVVEASVYSSKEALEHFEPQFMRKRHGAKEAAAAEPAAGGA
jgi:ribosomal protein S24E